MNLSTAVVLLIVLAMLAFALRSIFKKGSSGSCHGNCEGCGCSGECSAAKMAEHLDSL